MDKLLMVDEADLEHAEKAVCMKTQMEVVILPAHESALRLVIYQNLTWDIFNFHKIHQHFVDRIPLELPANTS